METRLTCQRVDAYTSTHLLEVTSELCILPDLRLVLRGERLQLLSERVQLAAHVRQLQLANLCGLGGVFLLQSALLVS